MNPMDTQEQSTVAVPGQRSGVTQSRGRWSFSLNAFGSALQVGQRRVQQTTGRAQVPCPTTACFIGRCEVERAELRASSSWPHKA